MTKQQGKAKGSGEFIGHPIEYNTAVVSVSPQFFGWVLGLGEMAEIMEPESVRQQMKEYIDKIAVKYHDS